GSRPCQERGAETQDRCQEGRRESQSRCTESCRQGQGRREEAYRKRARSSQESSCTSPCGCQASGAEREDRRAQVGWQGQGNQQDGCQKGARKSAGEKSRCETYTQGQGCTGSLTQVWVTVTQGRALHHRNPPAMKVSGGFFISFCIIPPCQRYLP